MIKLSLLYLGEYHIKGGICMRKFKMLLLLLGFLVSISGFAVGFDDKLELDGLELNSAVIKRAASLVKGVRAIPKRGVPSELFVFGDKAFPFLLDSKAKVLMAYAEYGKGSAVAMGNGSWISNSKMLNDKSVQRFLDNCVNLSKKRKVNILVLRTSNLSKYLSKKYRVTAVKNLPKDLKPYDLIFCAIPTRGESYFDDNEVLQISQWIKDGGVFIGGSAGWVFKSYGPGKYGADIKTDFVANKLFNRMGIAFGLKYGRGSSYPVEKVSLSNSRIANAHIAMNNYNKLKKIFDSINTNYRYKNLEEAYTANKASLKALSTIDDIESVLSKAQIKKIMDMVKREDLFPTVSNPIDVLKARETNLIILADFILRSGKYNDKYFGKISEDYPGVSKDASVVKKIISVDGSESRWLSTGLWLNPFQPLTVKLPSSAIAKGLKIRIGCHTDNIATSQRRKFWIRWPSISYSEKLQKTENIILSPYAGLVYIELPRNLSGKFDIEISGATVSPLFVLGETSLKDWKGQVAKSKAPLGEISGKHCVITTELSSLKKSGYSPVEIAEFWDKLVELTNDLAMTPIPKYKERYVIDRQIRAGSIHSGYPIFTTEGRNKYRDFVLGFTTKRGNILKDGSWGHFHELGHNHQNRDWTYDGSVEVTVNIFTLYAMEKLMGIKVREHKSIKSAQKRLDAFRKRGASFKEMQKDLIVALLMYVELQEAFGWESYKKVFEAYNSLRRSERPRTDAEKIDQWVLRFSEAVGYNLTPFFDSWKFPYNKKITKNLKHLPLWKK